MDSHTRSDLDTDTRSSDQRMARTLLALYLQLQLGNDQIWPLLASTAEQPEHRLEALAHPTPAYRALERPPP